MEEPCSRLLANACRKVLSDTEFVVPPSVETRLLKLLCSVLSAVLAVVVEELLEVPDRVLIRLCRSAVSCTAPRLLAVAAAGPVTPVVLLAAGLLDVEDVPELADCASRAANKLCKKLCRAVAVGSTELLEAAVSADEVPVTVVDAEESAAEAPS